MVMRTALDAPNAALDDSERNFVAKIREHGWFKTSVFGDGDGPGFSYTTGFSISVAMPEMIAFSMKSETLHSVFWDLYNDGKAGRQIVPGVRTDDVFANLPVYFFNVTKSHYREYLGWSRWFYGGDEFPCLQLVWADREGRFPWETGFDEEFRADQPDLTERGWNAELID